MGPVDGSIVLPSRSVQSPVSRFAPLAALIVLILNDHVLKHACPGIVTGKLSDFAGVFLLAALLAVLFPRAIACVVAGVLFVWWKSPLSEPLVAALGMTRVIDWTDLAALTMLPFAYRASTPTPWTKPAHALLALLSVVAFAATSPARHDIAIAETHELSDFATGKSLDELRARQQQCSAQFSESSQGTIFLASWKRFNLLGVNPTADALANVSVVDGRARLHFTRIHVTWESQPDEESYRRQLVNRLRRCLK
jgi:hypothetical protein